MSTKKILAFILSLAMLLSLTSVAAIAAENTIEPYTVISVTASQENNPVFTFTPDETKTYVVTSYAPDDVDPYCSIDSLNESYFIDDSIDSTNFAEKYVFEAGVEYTLTIGTYSDEDATFDIALECSHAWDDDTCTYCGTVCTHETEGTRFLTCNCGAVSVTKEIKLGDTVIRQAEGFSSIVVKFIPDEDVAAILYSDVFNDEGQFDVRASIFDAAGNQLAEKDDFNDSYDFVIWYEFEAGETYFFEIVSYYEDLLVEFSFVKAVHTVDDEEHPVIYTEHTDGTCQEMCYTEGIYCADCDEYLAGHNEDDLGFCQDDDCDYYCDICDEYLGDEDIDDDNDTTDDTENDTEAEDGIIGQLRNIFNRIIAYFVKFLSLFL